MDSTPKDLLSSLFYPFTIEMPPGHAGFVTGSREGAWGVDVKGMNRMKKIQGGHRGPPLQKFPHPGPLVHPFTGGRGKGRSFLKPTGMESGMFLLEFLLNINIIKS